MPRSQTETVERPGTVLPTREYELEPMFSNLLLSVDFYTRQVTGSEIKSRVKLVSALRDLRVRQVTTAASSMGRPSRSKALLARDSQP